MIQPESFITDNGIRVVVNEDPSLAYESVSLALDTSEASTAQLNYPHYLEHVLIRDMAQFDGVSYSQFVEASANKSNAGTYPELVNFTLDCMPQAFSSLFPALLSSIATPSLSNDAIEREKRSIASEMRERGATADVAIYDRAWENHGFTHTAATEAAGVDEVSAEKLREFHERFVARNNVAIVAVGPIAVREVARHIEDSSFVGEHKTATGGIGTRAFTDPRAPIVSGSETQQTLKYLQFISQAQTVPVAMLFDHLNNQRRTGAFMETANNEIGVYSAHMRSFPYPYDTSNCFYITTEGTVEQVVEVHKLAMGTLLKWCETAPSEKDLSHAKLKTMNGFILEGVHKNPSVIARTMLGKLPSFPNIVGIERMLEEVEAVTPEDIQKAAQLLLSSKGSFSLVGSDEDIERASDFLLQESSSS